ncbi:MAG: hypothetical protein K8F91_13665, partial [Candidatus Obscuribacterales bacterium]|nr:hypothetical protein [Candidatus Obscuribacterales bacterium]
NNDCNTEVVDEIVELSKRYGIISAYTSFLSTDPNEGRGRPPGSSGPQPFNMEARGFVSDAISMDRLSALPAGRIVVRQSGADDGFASTSKGLAGTGGLSSMFVFSKKHQVAMQTTGKASITVAGTRLGFEPNSSFGKADQKAEKESFARALAFASVSGKNAVALQKALSNLRTDTSSGNANGSRQVKVIGDKTFYLINGFWVDSSFEKVQEVTLKNIEFGSSAYFDLARENKAIVRYLGAGPQLIVVLDGQCYRITSASNSTG